MQRVGHVAHGTLLWVLSVGAMGSIGACSGNDESTARSPSGGASGAAGYRSVSTSSGGGGTTEPSGGREPGTGGTADPTSGGESGAAGLPGGGADAGAPSVQGGTSGSPVTAAGQLTSSVAGNGGQPLEAMGGASAGAGTGGLVVIAAGAGGEAGIETNSEAGAGGAASVPAVSGSLLGIWLYESGAPGDLYSVLEIGTAGVGESDGTYFADQIIIEYDPVSGQLATEAMEVQGTAPPISAGQRCYSVFEVNENVLTVHRAEDCSAGYFDGQGTSVDLVYQRVSEAECRRPVLTATVESGGETGSMNCAFDVTAPSYDCTLESSPSGAPTLTSYQYASLFDFVWEAKAVGRQTLVEKVLTSGSASTSTYTYEAGRLTGETSSDSVSTFTAWDDQDRPTAGTISTATCAGIDLVWTYDDTLRQWLETYDPSTGTGDCSEDGLIQFSTTYDANANTIGMHHWIDLPDESLWTFDILGTSLVCHLPQ